MKYALKYKLNFVIKGGMKGKDMWPNFSETCLKLFGVYAWWRIFQLIRNYKLKVYIIFKPIKDTKYKVNP